MMRVEIDSTLLADIRRYGQFDTNACFQCGSCTLTCNLTTSSASFPRKIVRYALLGLRKPLVSSLEPWLCYYCGECSESCPRQTEPAEAMMTLRRYLTVQYDWTGLTSKVYSSRFWGIGAHLAVGAAVLILVVLFHLNVVGLQLQELVSFRVGMEHTFDLMTIIARSVYLIAFLFLISSACRMYWFAVRRDTTAKIPLHYYITEARTLILHALSQPRFRDCTEESRWVRHLLLVFGCSVMFVVTFFFLEWFQTDNIYPLYHPQRWLGYAATGALLYAAGDILIGRLKKREQIHKFSDATDWVFPVSLLLTAVTGIAVHILRYTGIPVAAHYVYAFHLAVAVPMVMIELPFGKGSHIIYRPLAIYFQKVIENASHEEFAGEPVAANVG